MKSHEARVGEAVAALRARLESWGIDDAATKASEYVNDMLREGWRPKAPPVHQPPGQVRHGRLTAEQTARHADEARALMREAKEDA